MSQSTRQCNIKKGSRTPKGRLQRGSRLRYVRVPAILSLTLYLSCRLSLSYTHAHAVTDTERGSESPPTQQAARIAGRTHFINIDHVAKADSARVLISPYHSTFCSYMPTLTHRYDTCVQYFGDISVLLNRPEPASFRVSSSKVVHCFCD